MSTNVSSFRETSGKSRIDDGVSKKKQPQSASPPTAELSAVIDSLLDSLTSKFSAVSAEMFGKSTLLFFSCFLGSRTGLLFLFFLWLAAGFGEGGWFFLGLEGREQGALTGVGLVACRVHSMRFVDEMKADA